MLADIFTYNKEKYFLFILVLILINTILHPLTAGYVPTGVDGTLDYGTAFATNLITWAFSWNILGLIIGGGIAAFTKKKGEPLQISTARSVVKTIFMIQLIFANFHLYFLLSDLFRLFSR